MSDDGARQSLRGFVSTLEQAHPGEVVRITEPVDLAYQTQALALELERRRRFPVLIFEQVRGHSIPVVSNVMASRRGLATALGVGEAQLPEEYAKRLKELETENGRLKKLVADLTLDKQILEETLKGKW